MEVATEDLRPPNSSCHGRSPAVSCILPRWDPNHVCEKPFWGRVIRQPAAHVSGASSLPGALSVNTMKHVYPTHEETEAQRGEGLGLRLHSQL